MDILEMHVTFRELGQQMGMQTTRAILNEDVDICLNAAILKKVRTVIAENVGVVGYRDKILAQGLGISPINALRTLYTNNTISGDTLTGDGSEVNPYKFELANDDVMLYTGFQISYNGRTIHDARIIEPEKLGQTLRDFCNRAAKDAPIICVFGDENAITGEIYTGRANPTKPQTIRYLYIKMPAKVHYDEDDAGACVNCDLPVYLHTEIVANAVRIYLGSIGAIGNDNRRTVNTNTNPND